MENTESKSTVNPAQFIREVRQEVSKVTWPTRRETLISSTIVVVLVMIAAVFFLLADNLIAFVVKLILGY